MVFRLNKQTKSAIILTLILICISVSLYFTTNDYIPPHYRTGSKKHFFNGFIGMQIIGMIFILGGSIITFCYFLNLVHEVKFIVILFASLILSLLAILFAIVLDVLFWVAFDYILAYSGSVLAIASLASTKLNL